MTSAAKVKFDKLNGILKEMGSVLIAYSGGVDSTFLLKAASDALGDKVLAVTAVSETYTDSELAEAKEHAKKIGARHVVIDTCELLDERFAENSKDRCYYCKSELFSKLKEIAKEKGFASVIDGSNVDDLADHRPGRRAKDELGIKSPLSDSGLTKSEIRELSKELGLSTWDKPAMACLASRIPYGTRISREILERIDRAESAVRSLGFRNVRVRHHGLIARIEVGREEIPAALSDGMMDEITKRLESLGYTYVTIDLKGYRTGSMNEVLEELAI